MFQLHVGDTPCELTQKDYRQLGDMTDGYDLNPFHVGDDRLTDPIRYSGSDISIVVRDALMQPVRKVLSATHFKRISLPEDPSVMKWTPCSPGDPEAVEKTWTDIEGDELLEPPLRVADFVKSLESTRPTVTADDIRKHDDWTKESGRSFILV